MTILQQILSEMQTNDTTQKVRELCDKIAKEEGELDHEGIAPKGPNIFLVLKVPGRTTKELAFLTLEREAEMQYIITLSTIPVNKLPDGTVKRRKVWEINDGRADKILTEYAKKYKFLRGE
jgi:hypothetical protein